jgi:hypothetical protein
MCDPTVISIASLAAGVAGSGIGAIQQDRAQQQQKRAYQAWQMQQQKNKADETVRQNALRQQATDATAKATDDLGATSTEAAQAAEQARLASYLKGQGPASTATPQAGATPATPTSVADTSLTGATKPGAVITNTDDRYHTDLAQKLHDATTNANQQLGALATIGSYGGSFGGTDNRANEILARSGRAVDVANSFRRGSLGAFQTAQAENPAQISYTPSGIGNLGSELFSFGSQGLGKMFAGSAATPVQGKATTAPTMMGPNLPVTPHSGINYGYGGGTGYLY